MIISLSLKNFFSLRDEAVLDFTLETNIRTATNQYSDNIINFDGDKFVNIIGLFGGNAAGKSNIIKAIDYCRNLILSSHLNNEGDNLNNSPFKFDVDKSSVFSINFVTEGVEYEYSFEIYDGKIKTEELYFFPKKRKAKIFSRTDTEKYSFKKGIISRPSEIIANTSPQTLFLSRASSMNREIARTVYRFFLNHMVIGLDAVDLSKLSPDDFKKNKPILLRGLEVSDSDIVDIRLVESKPGQHQLQSFHRENPSIAFDFEKEESDGTKRLLILLMVILKKVAEDTSFFIDEFDLKLHLRLAEFILELIKVSGKSQMVFTSHNPLLIDRDSLLPEQIVFVTKHPDGNSEFASLSDFEDISKNMDIRKAYLQGRFDGVPYIGSAHSVVSELSRKQ